MSGPEPGRSASPNLDALLSSRTPSVEEAGPILDQGAAVGAPGAESGVSRVVDGDELGIDGVELRMLDVDAIVPNEFQPRQHFDDEALGSLTESIRELGVLQPVLVRPEGSDLYELIAGERRWRAARAAGLVVIPAIVRRAEDQSSLEQAIVENLHREDLNALEEAAAYRQLVDDFGLTQDEVAVRVGKSRSAVSNTLRLFQLPPVLQRMVISGLLGSGHARAILSLADPADQLALAERAVEHELSVRAVEDAVRSLTDGPSRPSGGQSTTPVGGRSAAALEVERLLSDRLATKVEVSEVSGNGRITIRFADREDLERIFGLLDT